MAATAGNGRLLRCVEILEKGPIQVKGLVEPVEVAELVGVSALRRRLQAAVARGLTRFVGRQQELAALRQALERAATVILAWASCMRKEARWTERVSRCPPPLRCINLWT